MPPSVAGMVERVPALPTSNPFFQPVKKATPKSAPAISSNLTYQVTVAGGLFATSEAKGSKGPGIHGGGIYRHAPGISFLVWAEETGWLFGLGDPN